MPSTIPLSKTIEYTKRFIYESPLLFTNEGTLAFSIADDVRQFILAPPFAWRWNHATLDPITCNIGQTDYTVYVPDFGWIEKAWIVFPSASGTPTQIFNSVNILSISAILSGVVTAVVAGNPLNFGFSVGQTISIQGVADPTFDSFQTATVTKLGPNSITYTQAGTGVSSTGGLIFNITSQNGPAVSANGQPVLTKELEIKDCLAVETVLGQPAYLSVEYDDNNGNITFRVQGSPDQQYQINIMYQKSALSFESTSDYWTPIPDYFNFLCRSGMVAKALEYKGDERFAYAQQQFMKQVVMANEGLSESEKSLFLGDRLDTAREQGSLQSGQQARNSRGGM